MLLLRPLEEAVREVEDLDDSLPSGDKIDEGIKSLIIGLRRWGIETQASCEGDKASLPYPYVDVNESCLPLLVEAIRLYYAANSKGRGVWDPHYQWVIRPFFGMVRMQPQDISRLLTELQQEAREFGEFLQRFEQAAEPS
ncbi:MAG: hypothetical protein Q7S63_01215 [bacterium]|nr:hypothetical protein [bacterium]